MSEVQRQFNGSRYAAFVAAAIEASGSSQTSIAQAIGYKNANNLSLIKSGKIPLPIEKVRPLARALNLDPARLMMMVLDERQPELAAFLREEGLEPLNEDEKRVLSAFRERFSDEPGSSKIVAEAIKSL
ncbi:hypothetical protein [Escherichia fergusonii]|uniref:hypothetical protein n=1 Tax=Escherichia fergusonii TaxID=564 RepID=UPI0006146959|nr:hypothetical protein [Escherichia fergusonii]KWW08244.1 hypothetical protein VL22_0201260 [Escherichia fergusonii]